MKLNYNYVRQTLINVSNNNEKNHTIGSLANTIVDASNQIEYSSAIYAIHTVAGVLIQTNISTEHMPINTEIEIIGLTEKGKTLHESVKNDEAWNTAVSIAKTIGGVSFEVMATFCKRYGG